MSPPKQAGQRPIGISLMIWEREPDSRKRGSGFYFNSIEGMWIYDVC